MTSSRKKEIHGVFEFRCCTELFSLCMNRNYKELGNGPENLNMTALFIYQDPMHLPELDGL